jgi:hypothetical protein
MSTKASEDTNPNSSGDAEDKEGGLMPAIVAGAGILAVVAVLALWPSGDDKAAAGDNAARASADGAAGAGARAAGAKRGGVQPRDADAADRGVKYGKVNPAVKLPAVGIAPGVPPPEEPPDFKNKEQEIAWYEKKLDQAMELRETRKKNVDHLPKVRERIEASDNPQEELATFESREKIVEENYAKAQERVEEIEAKLAELRQ